MNIEKLLRKLLQVLPLFSIALACRAPDSHTSLNIEEGNLVTDDHPGFKSAVQLVRFKDSGNFHKHCTGTLVAPNIVVTAAHCFPKPGMYPTHVRFINHGPELNIPLGEVREITSFKFHPEFRSIPDFDIAYVKFSGSTPEGFVSTPILPPGVQLNSGTEVEVVGFGTLGEDPNSLTARKLSAQAKITGVVSNYWTRGIFSMELNGSARTIPGDSGGPIQLRPLESKASLDYVV